MQVRHFTVFRVLEIIELALAFPASEENQGHISAYALFGNLRFEYQAHLIYDFQLVSDT